MLCATARTLARSQALARVWPDSAARADPLSDRRDGELIALWATPSDDRGSDAEVVERILGETPKSSQT